MKSKTVYLATKQGPQAFTLEGAWIVPLDGAPKAKRVYKSRAKRAAKTATAPETDETAAPVKRAKKSTSRLAKKLASKKGGQASLGD